MGPPAVLLWAACATAPGGGAGSAGGAGVAGLPEAERLLVPPGYGSLLQDEITLTLLAGSVQVKVTPLEEWMIRLTAPDTYQRLSSLARSHGAALAPAPGREAPTLFLVSFYSEEQGAVFHPEDLHLENSGRRFAPGAIRPMTQGWGTQRLEQRRAESAVYAFPPGVDFTVELVAAYRGTRNADWALILRDLLAEQARARARAGTGGAAG